MESYHRFFLATNSTHLKHTERDDRRDLSLRVSERYKGDHDYWTRVHADVEANAGAFLKYLMGVDLTDFNVRQKPATKELLEQKLQSLEGTERWWFDCLVSGVVGEWGQWPEFIATRQAIDVMMKTPGIRIYERPIAHKFVRALTDLCPNAKQEQRRQDGTRQRGLRLPSLEEARKAFEAWIGAEIEW